LTTVLRRASSNSEEHCGDGTKSFSLLRGNTQEAGSREGVKRRIQRKREDKETRRYRTESTPTRRRPRSERAPLRDAWQFRPRKLWRSSVIRERSLILGHWK